MIHRYPKECKAFYMKPDRPIPHSLVCRRLAPEGVGEIIGGSSGRTTWRPSWDACKNTTSPGTLEWYWTCAVTAACHTAASAWAWNAWWPGFAAYTMSGKPYLPPLDGSVGAIERKVEK